MIILFIYLFNLNNESLLILKCNFLFSCLWDGYMFNN